MSKNLYLVTKSFSGVGLGVWREVLERLRCIENRISDIEKILRNERVGQIQINVPESTLLKLPDHLRKTYLVLCDLKEATANDVAIRTGRVRAIESSYLNTLVMLNLVKKKRRSKNQVFSLK